MPSQPRTQKAHSPIDLAQAPLAVGVLGVFRAIALRGRGGHRGRYLRALARQSSSSSARSRAAPAGCDVLRTLRGGGSIAAQFALLGAAICATAHSLRRPAHVGSDPWVAGITPILSPSRPAWRRTANGVESSQLTRPLSLRSEERELSQVLAGSMDLQAEEIRILDWSWLH